MQDSVDPWDVMTPAYAKQYGTPIDFAYFRNNDELLLQLARGSYLLAIYTEGDEEKVLWIISTALIELVKAKVARRQITVVQLLTFPFEEGNRLLHYGFTQDGRT